MRRRGNGLSPQRRRGRKDELAAFGGAAELLGHQESKRRAVHEFGIASEIWEAVRKAAGAHGGGRVRAITVELGELNLIEDEQLRFWITALAEQDGSPGVELKITHLPVSVKCRGCGEIGDWRLESAAASDLPFPRAWYARPGPCPTCGSAEVEVIGGREIRVVSAEIDPSPLPSGHPSPPEAGKSTPGEGSEG